MLATTLPLPLTSGLFSQEHNLEEQLRRAHGPKSEGKKKQKSTKITVIPGTATDDEYAPIATQSAWGTPKAGNIPEKLSRGRSSRLYL